jgi:DNA-binding transcriptional ArsR family regulator
MALQAGFSRIAGLLADPAREAILVALAGGRALPAGELATVAGISPQSASGHLRKLVDGGIVAVWQQGRFRYFRLANQQVGIMLEALAGLTEPPGTRRPIPTNLSTARSCFSHLAGHLGVALLEALTRLGYISISDDIVTLTDPGVQWLAAIEIVAKPGPCGPRQLRLCLDWTERRFHLGGSVACAVLRHLLEHEFLLRGSERSLTVTRKGVAWFADLGIEAEAGRRAAGAPVPNMPSAILAQPRR